MAYYLEAYLTEEDADNSSGTANFSGIGDRVPLPTYDSIRQLLKPENSNLSDAEIDALLRPILGRMSPEEVEGFWDTVKSVAGQVGGVLKQAAPVLLPAAGAALGTVIGGPAGMAIGGQLGQLGAKFVAGPQPSTSSGGTAAQPAAPQSAPGAPAAAAPIPAGGTSALGQLMALIQNPALLKSLLGQVLGQAGQQTVPAGSQGTQLSFPALMNALSSLAGKAAQEAAEAYPEVESVEATGYLIDPSGNFLVDPADPDARAQRVMELLREDYLAKSYKPAGGAYDPLTEWLIDANLVK
jgi:hypothetical protein